jgi:S1-C subfamily serine protease
LRFLFGYALYAMLCGTLGSLASQAEDAQSAVGPATAGLIASYFVSFLAPLSRADLHQRGIRVRVVYDAKGDIAANAHVVGTATTVQVGLASGGKPLAASVVGVFAPVDLAVIRGDGDRRDRVRDGADRLRGAGRLRHADQRDPDQCGD